MIANNFGEYLSITKFEFWSGFFSNFLADLLVGGGIAIAIQFIFSLNEKRRFEFEERKKKEIKAIGYMKSLLVEVEVNTYRAKKYLIEEDYSKDLVLLSVIWSSLMVSGELPTVLTSLIFGSSSIYYSKIQEAKRIDSRLFEARLFKNSSLEESLKREFIKYLKEFQLAGTEYGIIQTITDSIKSSEENVENINKIIRKSNFIYMIQDFFKEKITNDINIKAPRLNEG